MDNVKTFILFSALFKYNNTGLHKCIDTIKDMFCKAWLRYICR